MSDNIVYASVPEDKVTEWENQGFARTEDSQPKGFVLLKKDGANAEEEARRFSYPFTVYDGKNVYYNESLVAWPFRTKIASNAVRDEEWEDCEVEDPCGPIVEERDLRGDVS